MRSLVFEGSTRATYEKLRQKDRVIYQFNDRYRLYLCHWGSLRSKAITPLSSGILVAQRKEHPVEDRQARNELEHLVRFIGPYRVKHGPRNLPLLPV